MNKNYIRNKISWYFSLLYFRQVILIRKFDLCLNEKSFATDSSLAFSLLSRQDIPNLIKFHNDQCVEWNFVFTEPEVYDRLEKGHQCYIAKDKNLVVGMYWMGVDRVYSPDLCSTFIVPPDSAISYNAFVHKAYRGKNIFPLLRKMAFNEFYKKGYRNAYGYSLDTNNAVQKVANKFSYNFEGKIYYGCLFGYKYLIPKFAPGCKLEIRKNFDPWQRIKSKKESSYHGNRG